MNVDFFSYTRPLIKASLVKKTPIEVRIGDQTKVIYKKNNKFYLADARCSHRGLAMKHSRVTENGYLQCPYHGKCLKPESELSVFWGFAWLIKTKSIESIFNHDPNFVFCKSETFHLNAPFHVVADNFNEGSHTPFVHSKFGPGPDDIRDVSFQWTNNDESMTIQYTGPQRKNIIFYGLNWNRQLNLKIKWTTFFQPMYMQYVSSWHDQKTLKSALTENVNYYFIHPDGDDRTIMHAFVFTKIQPWMKPFKILVKIISFYMTRKQVTEDAHFYKKIQDLPKDLSQFKLDRFDEPLVALRQHCQKFYPEKYFK